MGSCVVGINVSCGMKDKGLDSVIIEGGLKFWLKGADNGDVGNHEELKGRTCCPLVSFVEGKRMVRCSGGSIETTCWFVGGVKHND